MSQFPGSGKVIKGAIISIDAPNPLSRLIRFQYNPKEIQRSLTPNFGAEETGKTTVGTATRGSETRKLTGPPHESISLTIQVTAADDLEIGDPIAQSLGIHPQLAALEMLLYPKSDMVLAAMLKIDIGIKELLPTQAPLTLFYWGVHRIQPVRISSINITEILHDNNLNPIQADVALSMETLSYADFAKDSPAYDIFMAFQKSKEALASINGANNLTTGLFGA